MYMTTYVSKCIYVHYLHAGTQGGQERMSELLKVELKVVAGRQSRVLCKSIKYSEPLSLLSGPSEVFYIQSYKTHVRKNKVYYQSLILFISLHSEPLGTIPLGWGGVQLMALKRYSPTNMYSTNVY